jgi:hypothetical protein
LRYVDISCMYTNYSYRTPSIIRSQTPSICTSTLNHIAAHPFHSYRFLLSFFSCSTPSNGKNRVSLTRCIGHRCIFCCFSNERGSKRENKTKKCSKHVCIVKITPVDDNFTECLNISWTFCMPACLSYINSMYKSLTY